MGVEAYPQLAMKPEPVARFHPLIEGNNAQRGLSCTPLTPTAMI
jgi:hypothetical protein